jgi:hypothetical protein
VESDVEQALRTLLAAARADDPANALDALPLLATLRNRLDQSERALIESARAGGTSWATIATTLGLASRQAAEQRFLRLTAATTAATRTPRTTRDIAPARAGRKRQRSADTHHGPQITTIRAATRTLLRRIQADDAWNTRFTRAPLARATLEMAADAAPGALFALSTSALDDLPKPTDLPPAIAEAAEALKQSLSHNDSTNG